MDKNFELEVCGFGINNKNYTGAFTPCVDKIILEIIGNSNKVLHLFSGSSLIGDVRIDISRPEATLRCDVLDFIKNDNNFYDWVILDPPYEINRISKLDEYGKKISLGADVQLRRNLLEYLNIHTKNILWLDICAPLPQGFSRKKLWLLLPGGYHTVRILSWLIRKI